MSKSIRIKTNPGGDDNYVSINLTQDFDQLKVLSLSIDQEDVYRSFESNYGVVAGRIDINNGFGLKNAKVSIFIPLDDIDKQNDVKKEIYPYESITTRNSNGVRYNLLPNRQQNENHTPTGTFPSKRQILDNSTMIEIYDKYYKFTTTTNEAGDYMFFGVPVGEQQVFIDIDVSDIGFLSVRPYDLISKGKSEEEFVDRFTFSDSNDLDKLPQIINTNSVVNVLPFWADDLEEGRKVGITRFDYSVREYELTPTAMFMGSIFSDNENDSLSKNCRPRKKMGQMNELVTGEGVIEAITRTSGGDIVKSKDIPTDPIDENGNWAIQLPMNIRKVITDENGALIPSPDGKTGIATEADYRFRISMGTDNSVGRKRTRAKMLVPNMTNNYKFGEYGGDELITAQKAGEPIFKINEQLSYFNEEIPADTDPTIQYNYLEDFYTFRWKKIYTVRQYIPRYQPNGNESPSQKNFIGFKQILDGNGVNKLPYNRLFTKVNPFYSILCFLLTVFAFFVALVNDRIQLINNIFSNICEFRIPIPCFTLDLSGGKQKGVKYTRTVTRGGRCWNNATCDGNKNSFNNRSIEVESDDCVTTNSTDGDSEPPDSAAPDLTSQQAALKGYQTGECLTKSDVKTATGLSFGCSGKDYVQFDALVNDGTPIGEECEGTECLKCKETTYNSSENRPYTSDEDIDDCDIGKTYKGLSWNNKTLGICLRFCFFYRFEWKWSCPIRGLCNSCSNDDDCPGNADDPDNTCDSNNSGNSCRKPMYFDNKMTNSTDPIIGGQHKGVFKYKWESNKKTDQGKCRSRSVFTTPTTLPSECGSQLDVNTKYFVSGGKTSKKEEACDYLPEGYTIESGQITTSITSGSTFAIDDLDDKKINVFECDNSEDDCACKKGNKIENVPIGCLRRISEAGTTTNIKADETCKVNDGVGRGINEFCCKGCDDCDQFGKEEYYKEKYNDGTEDGVAAGAKLVNQCTKNCLGENCCEKIAPISLKCSEEALTITPATKPSGNCGLDDLITKCSSCKGTYFSPISNWVACQLEGIATSLGMLDFEFYNDWMNGSLYFPLIKRKVKIKRGKKGKRGQGQLKKDVFCDYDCDGTRDDIVLPNGNTIVVPDLPVDYQTPDELSLWSIRIRDLSGASTGAAIGLVGGLPGAAIGAGIGAAFGGKKVPYEFEGCKVVIPKRVSAREWYDTQKKARKSISFEGFRKGDETIPCSFTLDDWCQKDGNVCNDDSPFVGDKKIIIKQKTVDGPHGKPKYLKTGVDTDGDGITDATVWKNFGGHGHHKNKCKENFLIERLEYTKTDLSDCVALNSDSDGEGDIPVESTDGSVSGSTGSDSDCVLSCGAQGTAACTKNCECSGGYNVDPIYHGLVKDEDDELYYAAITESSDGKFNPSFYKKNMIFPTNITELGSSVNCDIDEAPFIIDELETTTYKLSEEELASKGGNGSESSPYKLKEKDANVNLRAYVDFGCDGVRCMNVRGSLTSAQIGSDLYDLNDTGLECNTCSVYNDVDTDIREYFCRRFSTYTPSTDGNTITDMKVNYVRPGSAQGENYYETYGDVGPECNSGFDEKSAVLIDDDGNKGTPFKIDNDLNDGDDITPGDKCGYYSNGSTKTDIKYFYGMDASSHTKNDLKNYPFDGSKLGSDADVDADVMVDDDEGISPFTTQTPYFFYFGLVPGKTALNKLVGKFFSDKINSETLEDVTEDNDNTDEPKAGEEKISPEAIIGSCLKT